MRRFLTVLLALLFTATVSATGAEAKGTAIRLGRTLIPSITNPGVRPTTKPGGVSTGKVGARKRKTTVTCIELGNDPSPMFTVTLTYKCSDGNLTGFQGCYGACTAPTAQPGTPPPPPPPVNVSAMIAAAMQQVPEPEPATSPPLLSDNEYGVVGIPFFFAVPLDQWHTVSPSAVQNDKFLTINATPTTLTFDPGDGTTPPTCRNAGHTVRTADQAKKAKQNGCYHLYQTAAPRTGYEAKLSINWTLNITTNLTPDQYTNLIPATMTTTTNITVPINEIQAVLTSPNN